MHPEIERVTRDVEAGLGRLEQVQREVARRVVGQDRIVDRLLIALLAGGHVLIEGVPGLGKTLLARTLAATLDVRFSRIQFTPDLLPADLTGTLVLDRRTGEFVPRRGPVFANVVLADEINRAPAKVQSALLEAMQERRVTIGETSHALPDPFLVLATQNPIEHEGTYALPEAQIDRFLFKLQTDYPAREAEREMLNMLLDLQPSPGRPSGDVDAISIEPVLTAADLLALRQISHRIYVDDRIREYVVAIVDATRPARTRLEAVRSSVRYGASPRATIYLSLAAKGHAFLKGRAFVLPEDVKALAPDVLRHRIGLSYEAEADEIGTDAVVKQVLDRVPIP